MESPGTAPGSEPRITGAFIAIFPVARNKVNIGAGSSPCKRLGLYATCAFCVLYPCIRAQLVNKILSSQEKARAG